MTMSGQPCKAVKLIDGSCRHEHSKAMSAANDSLNPERFAAQRRSVAGTLRVGLL